MELLDNIGSFIRTYKDRQRQIEAGSVFRHLAQGDSIETARVLNITSDYQGIQHVTFEILVKRRSSSAFVDRRVLSLESFRRRYTQLCD